MLAAESTPLPWAPPIIQINELANGPLLGNITIWFGLSSFYWFMIFPLKLGLSTGSSIKQAAFACINLATVGAFTHTCIDRISAVVTAYPLDRFSFIYRLNQRELFVDLTYYTLSDLILY